MTVRGFLAARQVMAPIMALVSSFADSGLPCFMHKTNNLDKLRRRFAPELSNSDAAAFMISVVVNAKKNPTTVLYDGMQRWQNRIYSPEFL